MIVTLSGVTGTGKSFFKNTISEELCFKNLVIVTTREKRIGEVNGIDKVSTFFSINGNVILKKHWIPFAPSTFAAS